jgi:hypothetical protein
MGGRGRRVRARLVAAHGTTQRCSLRAAQREPPPEPAAPSASAAALQQDSAASCGPDRVSSRCSPVLQIPNKAWTLLHACFEARALVKPPGHALELVV